MKKLLVAASLLVALTACTPPTPTEKAVESAMKAERNSVHYTRYINKYGYDVCVRGHKYLYIEAGNASHTIPIFGGDNRPVDCNEGDFE
jgi:hypothetical protein